MPALSSAQIRSNINSTLVQNGLFWIGVSIGAEQNTSNPGQIGSGLGLGPLQRIHFKKKLDVALTVSSLIPSYVDPTATDLVFNNTSFDNFEYYKSLLDPTTQILIRQDNKVVMTGYNISIPANGVITGSFNHVVFAASQTIEDYLEEYNSILDIPNGKGNEVSVYRDEELPVMAGGQFFPGVTSVNISSSLELKPLQSPGGIYGYYYPQPLGFDVNITTYEKHFELYQDLFRDVQNLRDIVVGPFTIEKAKMTSYSPGVNVGAYKQMNVNLRALNLKYS